MSAEDELLRTAKIKRIHSLRRNALFGAQAGVPKINELDKTFQEALTEMMDKRKAYKLERKQGKE